MGQRAIRRVNTPIDPMFFIPDGVDELFYDPEADDQLFSDEFDDSEQSVVVDIVTDESTEEDTSDYSDTPPTPQITSIASQTIRVSDTGAEVVDVVFICDDITGAEFEIRATAS